ncbi:MAG TPA: FAD-binding oxidoreductase [Gemmatimonadales bacterium]|nr:FAD-binding oxidoreductase [Gemmatimonadales bacterium]
MAVVGAGYTGLSAALTLARHGASVVVLERWRAGWGASGRNGGFVLPGYKPDPEELLRRCGVDRARALLAATHEAIENLEALVAREALDCGYVRRGWISLAAKPGHMRGLERTSRDLRRLLGHETTLLGAAELRAEIGSRRYHGGLLEPFAGALHPGRYCAGLAGAAVRAGAALIEGVEVSSVAHGSAGATIATSSGPLRAAEVLVATNGYTGPAFPAIRRRVVPVGSYVVATEPLGGLAAEVLPHARVMSDTWNLLHYFRLSDEGRLVFGGRASFTPTSVRRSARILEADLRTLFPQLAPARLAYAWSGSLGVARDRMPHAGRVNGVHYALAYAGHGVALSTWLGARMGDALAGRGAVPTLAGELPPIPLYRGDPWFLPLVGGYYRLMDWIR